MPPAHAVITLLGMLLQNAALIVAAAWALRRQGSSLRGAGLTRPSGRQVALGAAWGVAAVCVSYSLGGMELWACRRFLPADAFRSLQTMTDGMGAEHTFRMLPSPFFMAMFVVIGTLAAPFGEEVFFRGWMYNALKQRFRAPAGMVGSALVFALLHVSPLNLLPIFALGLLFAYVYERAGSLWSSIVMHGVNNAAAFALLAWSLHRG